MQHPGVEARLSAPPSASIARSITQIVLVVSDLGLAVAVVLFPLYLWESGLPQIADIALFLSAASSLVILARVKMESRALKMLRAAALFLAYASLVNVAFSLLLQRPEMLSFSAFYVFNLVVFLGVGVATILRPSRLLTLLRAGSLLALGWLLIYSIVMSGEAPRQALTFNNPNQLGYFAVVSQSIFFASIQRPVGRLRGDWASVFVLVSGFLLSSLSLSKAAIAAVVLVGVIVAWLNSRLRVLVVLVGIAGMAVMGVRASEQFQAVEARMASVGKDSDDSLEGRGYDRIWKHPGYLILGAGEGAYERFPSKFAEAMELHSSLGTVLFSYGLVGLVLLLRFFHLGLRYARPEALFLGPVLLYGLTHQGIRNPLFWVLCALVASVPFCQGLRLRDEKSIGDGRRRRWANGR